MTVRSGSRDGDRQKQRHTCREGGDIERCKEEGEASAPAAGEQSPPMAASDSAAPPKRDTFLFMDKETEAQREPAAFLTPTSASLFIPGEAVGEI